MVTWNSTWPDGSVPVSSNTTTGQQNTTYISTVQNYDHYWNTGSNEDGRHRQFSAVKKASDPSIPTDMDGVIFLKEVSSDNTRVEAFYKNSAGTFQFTPSFKSGTVEINTSSFVTVTDVPNGSFGQIWMWRDNSTSDNGSFGFFKCVNSVVHTYAATTYFSDSTTAKSNVTFANGDNVSGLNIRVKNILGSGTTYQYRIMYWGT